jgi:hypothetical protein
MQRAMRKKILLVLENRFGPVPDDVRAAVQRIQDVFSLDAMAGMTPRCLNLDAFRRGLSAHVKT